MSSDDEGDGLDIAPEPEDTTVNSPTDGEAAPAFSAGNEGSLTTTANEAAADVVPPITHDDNVTTDDAADGPDEQVEANADQSDDDDVEDGVHIAEPAGDTGHDDIAPLEDEPVAATVNDACDHAADLNTGPSLDGDEPAAHNEHRASISEARRKFCKDVKMPDRRSTAIHSAKEKGLSAAFTEEHRLWLRGAGFIYYGWVKGDNRGTPEQRKKVREAINEWELYGEIHFKELVESPGGTHRLDVRIAFDPSPSGGSWSLVGTDCTSAKHGEATMNLGWLDPNSDTMTDTEKAVILHEFGHVLGMLHEHQSPAGGGIPIANEKAAIEFYGNREGWDEAAIRQQVICTYNSTCVSSFSEVDRLSIMQYPMPASITGLDFDIDYNYELSEMDKAYMTIMYPRNEPHPRASKWNLRHALKTVGILYEAPETANMILSAAKRLSKDGSINPINIRDIFSAWTKKAHASKNSSPNREQAATGAIQHTIKGKGNPKASAPPAPPASPASKKAQAKHVAPSRADPAQPPISTPKKAPPKPEAPVKINPAPPAPPATPKTLTKLARTAPPAPAPPTQKVPPKPNVHAKSNPGAPQAPAPLPSPKAPTKSAPPTQPVASAPKAPVTPAPTSKSAPTTAPTPSHPRNGTNAKARPTGSDKKTPKPTSKPIDEPTGKMPMPGSTKEASTSSATPTASDPAPGSTSTVTDLSTTQNPTTGGEIPTTAPVTEPEPSEDPQQPSEELEVPAVPDLPPSSQPSAGLDGGGEVENSDDVESDEDNIVNLPPHSMCATDEMMMMMMMTQDGGVASPAAPHDAPHAVNSPDLLKTLENLTGQLGKDASYRRDILWAIVDCPLSSAGPSKHIPAPSSAYQSILVESAWYYWAECASISAKQTSDLAKAHVILTFQPGYKKASRCRSYYSQIRIGGDVESRKLDKNAVTPAISHNICFRGVTDGGDDAGEKDPSLEEFKAGHKWRKGGRAALARDLDQRTIAHEIGHFLGLHHESSGIYGYYLRNQDTDTQSAYHEALNMYATKFDTGSVMDHLSVPIALGSLESFGNNLNLIRTAFRPSTYDLYNIAFMHPGTRLVDRITSSPPAADETRIRLYASALQLNEEVVTKLINHANVFNWPAVRKTYQEAIREQQEDWNRRGRALIRDMFKFAKASPTTVLPIAASKGISSRKPIASHGISGGKPAASRGVSGGKPPASHGVEDDGVRDGKATTDATLATSAEIGFGGGGLLKQIYERLAATIGPTGAQILTLQAPTRYLSKEEYQFELSGIYSNFTKPVVVAEAEFRLTDALYDPAAIVSAPNGKSLSNVYRQVVNNFVPKYDQNDRKAREERERIRAWLLTEVGDQNSYYKFDYNTVGGGLGDDTTALSTLNSKLPTSKSLIRKMTRMEFACQLTQDYYEAQQKWELDRDGMIADAIRTKDQNELAAVTRKLVHITQAQQGKLAMRNADAVVRGYSHIVREALGHLDVATPAEILQDAKDAFRTSSVSSLYGASSVYPVLMSPVDWSAALDTGFTPEDLSENPDLIMQMIKAKSSAIDLQKRQLALLQSSADGDPATLKAEVETAAKALNKAKSNLYSKYLDSTVELAKIVIYFATDGQSGIVESAVGSATGTATKPDAKSAGPVKPIADTKTQKDVASSQSAAADAEKELASSVQSLDPNGTVDDIKKQIEGVENAQLVLQQKTSAWNSKKAALARAEATNTTKDQTFIESSISTLTSELEDLNARLESAKKAQEARVALAEQKNAELSVEDLDAKPPPATGGSRWQEIHITHEQTYSEQRSATSSSATSEAWDVNFWIASAGGSNEENAGGFKAGSLTANVQIDISMKITLVTVDRSSWFQPQLFDNSSGYMKNNSAQPGFNAWKPGQTAELIADDFRKSPTPQKLAHGLLPCYPVGYILCKDVLIKITGMKMESDEAKTHILDKSQASGGFLCFSYNHATEKQQDPSAAKFETANNGMIVRIPGPQVLGYVQQIIPRDESIEYDPKLSLGKEFYLPPVATPELSRNAPPAEAAAAGTAGSGAAHAFRPPAAATTRWMSEIKTDISDTGMRATRSDGSKASSGQPAAAHGSAPPKTNTPPPSYNGAHKMEAANGDEDDNEDDSREEAGTAMHKTSKVGGGGGGGGGDVSKISKQDLASQLLKKLLADENNFLSEESKLLKDAIRQLQQSEL